MTTGPRPTPHPIILHVDDSNNPVRLAEASSIYVTSATIVSATITTLSATNYLGLGNLGGPGGSDGQIQFNLNNGFAGEEGFTYNNDTYTLNVININSTNTTTASNLRSTTTSSTNLSAVNIRANTISATTVCATNYDALLDALSFQNLDNRYLNSSGDSVTGSIYIQNLSSTNLSATNWLGIPSSVAVWNASAIRGVTVTSTQPTLGQALVYNGNVWTPSSVDAVGGGSPGGDELSIQFRNGSFFSGVDSIKYNSSLSGVQSVVLSSTNLSSTNIRSTSLISNIVCATLVSATTYQNLQEDTAKWNASKIYGTPFNKGELVVGDFITYDGATAWTNTTKENAAGLVSPQLHTETWNASGLRGYTVTSTAPTTNNVLVYNGSVWTPSSAIALASVSSTSLSATSARVVGLSATTISATNWQGLPSAVATWNASAIQGSKVLGTNTPAGQLGFLSYNPGLNEYQAISISSLGNNGLGTIGYGAASYLASANSNYFAINEGWQLLNDYPENKDVLVFSSNMYGLGSSRWTWQQASSLVPAAGGYAGLVQFRGPNGQFSSDAGIYFDPTTKILSIPNGIYSPIGSLFGGYITVSGGGNISGTLQVQTVSATTYKLFGADTSAASPTLSNNQTIIYDTTGTKWKPGYTVYQATGTPTAGLGSNGDIYFQYLP